MGIFAIGIEHPLDMTVQRSHDANPRHHRVAAAAAQHQRFDSGLPFRQVGFLFRQLRDVVGGNMIGSSNGVDQGTKNALYPALESKRTCLSEFARFRRAPSVPRGALQMLHLISVDGGASSG
jgi:hypothetical protein